MISEVTREKLRISHLGKPGYWTGKKRPNMPRNPDLMKNYICPECGKLFRTYKAWDRKYCSRVCQHKNKPKHTDEWKTFMRSIMVGRKMTPEWRSKMSKSMTGNKNGAGNKGKKGQVAWNKGKKWSKEVLKKFAKAQCGEKSRLWQGGVTPLSRAIRACFEYRQWRSDVFTRDEFICLECESRDYLHSHHIVSLAILINKYKLKTLTEAKECKELWNINNGQTLCRTCHAKYGGARCLRE